MKRKIYLMRHGNPGQKGDQRRCLGTTDVALSDLGKSSYINIKTLSMTLDGRKSMLVQ